MGTNIRNKCFFDLADDWIAYENQEWEYRKNKVQNIIDILCRFMRNTTKNKDDNIEKLFEENANTAKNNDIVMLQETILNALLKRLSYSRSFLASKEYKEIKKNNLSDFEVYIEYAKKLFKGNTKQKIKPKYLEWSLFNIDMSKTIFVVHVDFSNIILTHTGYINISNSSFLYAFTINNMYLLENETLNYNSLEIRKLLKIESLRKYSGDKTFDLSSLKISESACVIIDKNLEVVISNNDESIPGTKNKAYLPLYNPDKHYISGDEYP